MNKVIDSMLAHRSIRSYTDRTVSDEDLNSIIRAVQAAKNWVNRELVSIIAVKNTDHRRRLAELCGNQVHIAAMGGVDAIVFTGGIGEHDAVARAKICHHMDWLGIRIDTDKNKHIQGDVCEITAWGAKVRTLVIATDEELMIARDTKEVVEK